MYFETTIDKGSTGKVKIRVRVFVNNSGEVEFPVDVSTKAPNKRTWVPVVDTNAGAYRFAKDRHQYILEKQLDVCTPADILDARLKCWANIKPVK